MSLTCHFATLSMSSFPRTNSTQLFVNKRTDPGSSNTRNKFSHWKAKTPDSNSTICPLGEHLMCFYSEKQHSPCDNSGPHTNPLKAKDAHCWHELTDDRMWAKSGQEFVLTWCRLREFKIQIRHSWWVYDDVNCLSHFKNEEKVKNEESKWTETCFIKSAHSMKKSY